MPQTFNFQLGPITVTVDGVPDVIQPDAVHVDLFIFSDRPADDDMTPMDRFVATVQALGGADAFGISSSTTEKTAVDLEPARERDEPHGKLTLFMPKAERQPIQHPALDAVLEAEKASV